MDRHASLVWKFGLRGEIGSGSVVASGGAGRTVGGWRRRLGRAAGLVPEKDKKVKGKFIDIRH